MPAKKWFHLTEQENKRKGFTNRCFRGQTNGVVPECLVLLWQGRRESGVFPEACCFTWRVTLEFSQLTTTKFKILS